MLGLDLGEAIDAERVGATAATARRGRDSQIDEILRVVPGERPGLAAVGAGVEFGQRRRGGNGKVGVALIREIVGLDDAAGGHWRPNRSAARQPPTLALAQSNRSALRRWLRASSPSPQRQGRMVVGIFPPSANHSLQLCSRKPSCS
jgi:hypothetical protein